MDQNTVPAAKLDQVKNANEKPDILQSLEVQKFMKKVATEISNEVVKGTVSKAITHTEFTKDLVHETVRKAVRMAESQKKYPPLPESLEKLSEPTTATYISLYNKHRNVLRPKTVGSVKEKIAEYLEKIEELSINDKMEKDIKADERKNRKMQAIKEKKQNEYKNFCSEKCDEIFEKFLSNFTESLKVERQMPKPLIMGPKSTKLFQNIRDHMENLLTLKTVENKEAVDSSKTKKVGAIKKTETSKLVNQKPGTDTANLANSIGAADKLVTGTGDTIETKEEVEKNKEKAETDEIIDKLSYFLMEFVQNSLVEVS